MKVQRQVNPSNFRGNNPGVALEDIIRFEMKQTAVSEDIIASIEITLEYAGIDFISPDKIDGAGLAIRKQQHE